MTSSVRALVVGVALGTAILVTAGPGPAAVASTRAPTQVVLADLPVPQGDAGDPEDVRRKADDILSQPEYQPPEKTLFERAQEEISKALQKVLNGLSGGGVGSAFGWICIVALLGLVGFLIFRFGRTVQRSPGRAADVTVEVHRTPTEWLSAAERYEAEGEWKEALRCRYRAMVADLVSVDAVPDIPGRTVGEHRRDVQATVPAAAPEFNGAAELFERAWYGDLPTGPDENQQFRSLADRVLTQAGSS